VFFLIANLGNNTYTFILYQNDVIWVLGGDDEVPEYEALHAFGDVQFVGVAGISFFAKLVEVRIFP
jgi:hypothetical protein